jgi:hypothetical protein
MLSEFSISSFSFFISLYCFEDMKTGSKNNTKFNNKLVQYANVQSLIQLDSGTYTVNPNRYSAVPLNAVSPGEGFYLITFFLHQPTATITEDIDTFILDEENYNLWAYNFELINNRRVNSQAVNPAFIYQRAKISTSSITLVPPKAGKYFIVLSNQNSTVTKTIDITVSWVSYDISLTLIRAKLQARGWNEVWVQLSMATQTKNSPDRLNEACYNLRTSLTMLLKHVCERLDNTAITFDSGKTPDIGAFKKILRENRVPEDIISAILSVWSQASERAHPEKKDGKPAPFPEVAYIYNQVIAAFEYLLSLHLGIY